MNTPHALVTHLARHPLLDATQRIVVAVSGGPDSLALLHALCQIIPHSHLAVFHLDHGLRGAQSAADARFVAETAHQLGVSVQCDLADIPREAPTYRNVSEAARVVRYRRLAHYAATQQADVVCVAHTLDDQAETVLMRLLRGSGTSGLAGMRPWIPWMQWAPADLVGHAALVRPLLGISRATIIDYCTIAQLTPRHDPSNHNQHALRVRVRTQLLPFLQHEQPHITALLGQSAEIAGDDADFIDAVVQQHWEHVVVQSPHWIAFEPKPFCALHVSVQRATIRHAIRTVYGTLRGVSLAHIEALRTAIRTHTAPTLALPIPMHAARYLHRIGIGTPPLPVAPAYTGAVHTLEHGVSLACGAYLLTLAPRVVPRTQDNPWCVVLHPHHTYTVRTRRSGDRIGIGHNRHRRIQDVFVDARIPASQRAQWPLICCNDDVVWIVGVRVDPRFCVAHHAEGVQISCLMDTESTV